MVLFFSRHSMLERNKNFFQLNPGSIGEHVLTRSVGVLLPFSEQKQAEYRTEQVDIPGLSSTWLA